MTITQLFDNYQKCFGRLLTPFEIEDIQKWIDEDGMPIEIVNLALREAVRNNRISWKYINKILIEWKRDGDVTIEKVEQRLARFEQQKSNYAKPRQSNIPDWSNPDYKGPTLDDILAQTEGIEADGTGDF